MAHQCDAVGNHNGIEAFLRFSLHQHAVAWNQFEIVWIANINGRVAILHKQCSFITAVVGNRRLEGDGQPLAGLGIGQRVNGLHGRECGGRRGPGSRCIGEKDGDR